MNKDKCPACGGSRRHRKTITVKVKGSTRDSKTQTCREKFHSRKGE